MDEAEDRVSKFYNTIGWETVDGITEDARRWEDLREHAREYVSKCRLRVLRHIPDRGENILDMASGPIQFKEYLEYSRNFKKRYCVDLSAQALKSAKEKIGDHGVFLQGSFFDIPLEENFFDCSISLHTIYHIDKEKQEEAIRKLIRVTKPGKPVIIIYSNPNWIFSFALRTARGTRASLIKLVGGRKSDEESVLYFYAHPLEWWDRFKDVTSLEILPWRSFESKIQKRLIPNNNLGSKILNALFNLEERFPRFFVTYFQYPLIILTKKF